MVDQPVDQAQQAEPVPRVEAVAVAAEGEAEVRLWSCVCRTGRTDGSSCCALARACCAPRKSRAWRSAR